MNGETVSTPLFDAVQSADTPRRGVSRDALTDGWYDISCNGQLKVSDGKFVIYTAPCGNTVVLDPNDEDFEPFLTKLLPKLTRLEIEV